MWAGRRKKFDDQHMHITKYWLHDWDICLVTTVHLMFAPENSELAEYLQLLCTITAAVPQIILQMFVLLPVSQKLRLMFTQTYIKLQRKRNTGCVCVCGRLLGVQYHMTEEEKRAVRTNAESGKLWIEGATVRVREPEERKGWGLGTGSRASPS